MSDRASRKMALFVVTGDPRVSGRVAEAIRIAAGIGTWKRVDVIVYLRGPAVLALSEWVDELVDEDNFTHYLPLLRDFGRPVYVQAGAGELADLGESTLPFEEVDDAGLTRLALSADYLMRFDELQDSDKV